jgi:metal-responsive CopG/Arc/MetJ family transcriptional regulator
MTTAVTLPDRVYLAAERHAKRTHQSRSQVYAEALTEYLARRAPRKVTETMNAVVDRLGDAGPDPFVNHAGRRTLTSVEC